MRACAVRGATPERASHVPNVVLSAWMSTVRFRSSRLGMPARRQSALNRLIKSFGMG